MQFGEGRHALNHAQDARAAFKLPPPYDGFSSAGLCIFAAYFFLVSFALDFE